MVRPKKRYYSKGASGYGRGSTGYGTYVPTAALAKGIPFRPGFDRRGVGTTNVLAREKKLFDTTIALGVGATGGLFDDSLVHVAQGTADNERIGRKITVTNINLRANAQKAQDATDPADVWRCILYVDTQCNGSVATVTEILTAAGTNTFRNLDNATRFKILLDKTEDIASTIYDGTNNLAEVKNRFFDFYWYDAIGIPILYNSTTGVIAEITQNNIGVLWINLSGKTSLNGIARVRYTDS